MKQGFSATALWTQGLHEGTAGTIYSIKHREIVKTLYHVIVKVILKMILTFFIYIGPGNHCFLKLENTCHVQDTLYDNILK